MRSIDTETLALSDFAGIAPKYAILSHRWGDEEVGYKDFVKERIIIGAGYRKIVDCCAYALSRHMK